MKALALFSGGLDSMLSVLILRKQDIFVEGVYFETPFFTAERAIKSARKIDLPLRIIDITDEMLKIIKVPKFGYGQGLNPCLDCHLFMCKKACEIKEKESYDFIVTGEVLGQRPLTQTKQALLIISKNCPCSDYIIRPLSAKVLPLTIPEIMGWVDRDKFFGIKGRSRKEQIRLANEFGLKDYPSPAGGCLLTDKNFSKRLKDLFKYQENISRRDLELLKIGRHFRLNSKTKAIVGRNQKENKTIISLSLPKDTIIQVTGYPGPIVLLPNGGDEEGELIAKLLAASYSDAPEGKDVKVRIKKEMNIKIETAQSLSKNVLRKYLIGHLDIE